MSGKYRGFVTEEEIKQKFMLPVENLDHLWEIMLIYFIMIYLHSLNWKQYTLIFMIALHNILIYSWHSLCNFKIIGASICNYTNELKIPFTQNVHPN
jgi:hypothetical protein